MLSRCLLDISVGVWAFVTGLSLISSFEAKRDGVINPHKISFMTGICVWHNSTFKIVNHFQI